MVFLLPHDARWSVVATDRAAQVATILGTTMVTWHHIGSTSIRGIHAKPVIDLMPLVTSVDEVDALRAAFEAAGYCWYGEFGLPGRRYVNLDDPESGDRITNVHIYAVGNPEVERHLAFRDYLRAHSAVAKQYELIKLACAAKNQTDIYGYMDCKDATCKQIERQAVEWYRSGR
jgi:GrpB-like predicted nucleotidyltransferase (UPF0157 family)